MEAGLHHLDLVAFVETDSTPSGGLFLLVGALFLPTVALFVYYLRLGGYVLGCALAVVVTF